MTYSIRSLPGVITLGVFVGGALCDDDSLRKEPGKPCAKANKDVFDHQRFCVTIWPAKAEIKAGEEFAVNLRVVNSSDEPQSFKVWSCSWDVNWHWRNHRFGYTPWDCYRNGIIEIRLQPGEAYEKMLSMKLVGEGTSKTESLRMGFAPSGEQKTYWSNEVVLGVE